MARVRLNPGAVRAEMNRLARRDAERVAQQVQDRAELLSRSLVQVRSGAYSRGWFKESGISFRGPTVVVGNTAPHALYIEQGTRPHVILPRRARALRFEINGRVVYARRVNHPGTKPYHVLARATREVGIANGYDVRITG